MPPSEVVFALFVVFAGAAVMATAALFARQAMIVAYIAVGALCGPGVLGLVRDTGWLAEVAEIGIMFLLYLLGMKPCARRWPSRWDPRCCCSRPEGACPTCLDSQWWKAR